MMKLEQDAQAKQKVVAQMAKKNVKAPDEAQIHYNEQ